MDDGHRRRLSPTRCVATSWTLCVLLSPAARAVPCSVPGTHASVQQAVADPSCTTIQLAAGTYEGSVAISRSLALSGTGSPAPIVAGRVAIAGAGTAVLLADLRVDTSTPELARCYAEAVVVSDGARLEGSNLDVRQASGDASGCPPTGGVLFTDGFELGDTSAWSVVVPKRWSLRNN